MNLVLSTPNFFPGRRIQFNVDRDRRRTDVVKHFGVTDKISRSNTIANEICMFIILFFEYIYTQPDASVRCLNQNTF